MPRRFLIDVPNPCQVGWQNMEGDDTVRFCSLCQQNVYNLSEMTEQEVGELFEIKGGRVCVSIRSRSDGSTYTDNCPRRLRQLRNFLRYRMPVLLVLLAGLFHQTSADAQGLIGAPVEGRFGQSNEIGGLADYGYDTARDVSHCITCISFLAASVLAFWRIRVARLRAFKLALAGGCLRDVSRIRYRSVLIWLGIVVSVSIFAHLAGIYAINNYGGLSSGL